MDHCEYCVFFIGHGRNRCVLHGEDDKIVAAGWCKEFREGGADEQPRTIRLRSGHNKGKFVSTAAFKPLGILTKKESGYVDDARASMKGHDWRKREG